MFPIPRGPSGPYSIRDTLAESYNEGLLPAELQPVAADILSVDCAPLDIMVGILNFSRRYNDWLVDGNRGSIEDFIHATENLRDIGYHKNDPGVDPGRFVHRKID